MTGRETRHTGSTERGKGEKAYDKNGDASSG